MLNLSGQNLILEHLIYVFIGEFGNQKLQISNSVQKNLKN